MLMLNSICSAQKDPSKTALLTEVPSEKITIKINDSLMLSGETLYYDFYCLNSNAFSTISKIGYVELVSANKDVVFKHKLQLNNGRASGDFFVPSSLKTGHYKLIAYTHWSLNNRQHAYDETDIYIVNPFLNASDNKLKEAFDETDLYIEISQSDDVLDMASEATNVNISIATDAKTYAKRHKIALQIKTNDNGINYGNYTLSVNKRDAISVQLNTDETSVKSNKVSALYLPDLRGELISGKVIDNNGNPINNETVSLSVPGNDLIFRSATTNSKGEFYFNMTKNYSNATAYLQLLDSPVEDYKISVDNLSFTAYNELKFYPFKIDKTIAYWVEQRSIYNQIESAYYNLKKDSILEIPSPAPFYGKPDLVYVLDDYTRFKTVRETFVEVVEQAAIRDDGDGYKFMIFEDETISTRLFADASPLVLFNGLHALNEKLIVEYDPSEIESVSLVKGTYVDGSKVYNGIIDIRLKNPDQFNFYHNNALALDLNAALKPKDYFSQTYTVRKAHTPDFRTQLLWMPMLKLDASLKEIEFYTSDVPGIYDIKLEGFTNQGKKVFLNRSIEVK